MKRIACAALCAALLSTFAAAPARAAGSATVAVDASQDVHAISPNIYGMAMMGYSGPATIQQYASDLKLPLFRYGGNAASRYNWEDGNATNAARDWGFRNRQADGVVVTAGPSSSLDGWIAQAAQLGAASMIAVPMMGWVAKNNDNNTLSASVPATGAAADASQGPDGISGYNPAANQQLTSIKSSPKKPGAFSATPNLTDGVVYQDEWVHHLLGKFGAASAGGVKYYLFDNEYDLWHSTHTDVHPQGASAAELVAKYAQFASLVKSQDSSAQLFGPGGWGWLSSQESGLDQVNGNKDVHGGEPLYAYFLDQVRAADAASASRSLDYLDIHYYPQASGLLFPGNTDAATNALRLRQVRALWDPSYRDESWQDSAAGAPIQLIPMLKSMIASHYPGTRLSITEWNFGGESNINGGLAVADVLGVFAREGLDAATYWTYPAAGTPAYLAFKLFRNADGHGRGFGDTSVRATSSDQATVDSYAAVDSAGGALTLVLVNKDPANAVQTSVALSGFSAASAAATYTVSGAAPSSIVSGSLAVAASSMTVTLPAASMVLVVVPGTSGAATTAPAAPTGLAAAPTYGSVTLSWNPAGGASTYQVLRSLGGSAYAAVATTPGTSFTDTTVTAGATYSYEVVAANSIGQSAASAAVSAAVPTPPLFSALYDDALAAGWQDWSWATHSLASTSPVFAGKDAVSVTFGAWTGLYFAHNGYSAAGQKYLDFEANGLSHAGNAIAVVATVGGAGQPAVAVGPYCAGGTIPANAWTHCKIPLTALGATSGLITGITFQENAGLTLAAMSFDQIGFSNDAVVTQPSAPAAPTGLQATASAGKIALTWTASTGATSYSVLRSTGGAAYASIATSATAAYSDTTVAAGATYSYEVVATNSTGSSAASAAASATVPVPAPAAPTGLKAVASAGKIALTWTASTGATSYSVLRSTGGAAYASIGTSATAAYSDTTVAAGATYSYEIVATNSTGSSAASAAASATVPVPAPAAPTGLKAVASAGKIALTWTASTGATSYSVLRSTGGAAYASIGTSATAAYSDTAVAAGATYSYEIVATNSTGSSAASAAASATVPVPAPAAPTALTATVTNGKVALSWTLSPGAASYSVLRSTGGGAYTSIGTSATAAYTDTTVAAGATYSYEIVASNAGGSSPASAAAAAVIPAAPTFTALYDDGLEGGWLDWSWATHSLTSAAPVYLGKSAISATFGAWTGLYFDHAGFSPAGQTYLDFEVNGGTRAGSVITAAAVVAGSWKSGVSIAQYCTGGTIAANAWTHCKVPLAALSAATGTITGIALQEGAGLSLPVMYFDQIGFSN